MRDKTAGVEGALFGVSERMEAIRKEMLTTQFLILTLGIVILAHVWSRKG